MANRTTPENLTREDVRHASEVGVLLFHDDEARIVRCRFCRRAIALPKLDDHFEDEHNDQLDALNAELFQIAKDADRDECEIRGSLIDEPCRKERTR